MFENKGFTLIELMITVAIIAILATVAFPSYERYVDRSYRTQAQVLLQQMAQRLERRYSQTYSYGSDTEDTAPQDLTPPLVIDGLSGEVSSRYDFTVTIEDSGNSFDLTAEPAEDGPQADDDCGTLTLTQDGKTGASSSDCWT